MYTKFFKRLLDIVLSFIGLIVLAIPMMIIAIVIKCDSKGPAIFKTERVGRYGKPFKFYKFRSMLTNAPKDVAPNLLKSEDYITKVGKFIRKTSLDEFPQLLCIFTGSMTIIGPRPAGFSEKELNQKREELGILNLKPGLTGHAQINGRDITAADIDLKVKYDKEYLDTLSFKTDLKIFFKTIKRVLLGSDIVEGEGEK